MDNNNFDQKLVDKIKQEHITPRPRWHFLLKDYVIRAFGALALLVGSAAVSVMVYLLRNNDWEMRAETRKTFWEFFLLTLPYFWLILLGFFIFLLYYNLKHSKQGYRYPVWAIASISFLASIILGLVFYSLGLGEKIDMVLGERAPLYEKVFNRHFDFWLNPAEGRLIGIVLSRSGDQEFILLDPRGQEWQVTAKEDSCPIELLRVKQPVNLTGQVIDENQFLADKIHPVRPGRGFWSRQRPSKLSPDCSPDTCPMMLPPGVPLPMPRY